MKILTTLVCLAALVLASTGNEEAEVPAPRSSMTNPKADLPASSSSESEPSMHLGPILAVPDEHGHLNPLLENSSADNQKKPLIGVPDGHDDRREERPLLGRPDGHDDRSEDMDEDDPNDPGESYDYESRDPDSDDYAVPEEFLNPDRAEYYDEGRDQSSEEHNNEDEDEDDGEVDEVMLVRCKRPMCLMACEFGFQTDDTGCPTCHCLDDPCVNTKCAAGLTCRARSCTGVCKMLLSECVGPATPPVACAMPMCMDECIHGYRTNDHGCMTCDCVVPNSDPRLPGAAPENLDRPQVCPLMKCVPCPSGYKIDARGCQTCECLVQCAEPMCENNCGTNGYKRDTRGCMTCDCKESAMADLPPLEVRKSFPCATPMCATYCPLGYKNNAAGCMTCDCKQGLCGEKECDFGQICQNRTINFRTAPTCIPQPLCFKNREMAGVGQAMSPIMSGQYAPECESDGSFKPMQCNTIAADCWCVDDRGTEIAGSRTAVYMEAHKPLCSRNYTVMMSIFMDLEATTDSLMPSAFIADKLKKNMPEMVSDCIMMDKQFISVHSVIVEDVSDEIQLYHVDLLVRNDGRTDLPSASEYMRRRLYRNSCPILVDAKAILPRMETFTIKYMPSLRPVGIMEDPRTNFVNYSTPAGKSCGFLALCLDKHAYLVIIGGSLAAVIFLAVIFVVIVKIVHNRHARSGTLHFRHQPLENQMSTSSEKSLLSNVSNAVDSDAVLLISSEPLKNKEVVA